jgi:CspA family cold shock protein
MQGTLKWFNSEKGYGFINIGDFEDQADDRFVHRTGWRDRTVVDRIPGSALAGRRVEFELEEGPKGLQCCDVALVEDHEPAA